MKNNTWLSDEIPTIRRLDYIVCNTDPMESGYLYAGFRNMQGTCKGLRRISSFVWKKEANMPHYREEADRFFNMFHEEIVLAMEYVNNWMEKYNLSPVFTDFNDLEKCGDDYDYVWNLRSEKKFVTEEAEAWLGISNREPVAISQFDGKCGFYCDEKIQLIRKTASEILKEFPRDYRELITDKGTLVEYRGIGGDVIIPEGVLKIGKMAFAACNDRIAVTFPPGITEISNQAFISSAGLTSISIPNSVKKIGEYAFRDCIGLQNFVIPDSVTCIEWGAFSKCTGLTSVTIPKTITRFEPNTFDDCNNIRDVFYSGTEEQWQSIDFSYGNERSFKKANIHFNFKNGE